MKVGILAGGYGSRLAEETTVRPKPMVEIGGMPILWHIMKHYETYGHHEFAIALGYKGEYIKRWFTEFVNLTDDLVVNTASGRVDAASRAERPDWNVHLIDTGLETKTAGRIRRLRDFFGDETFLLTYGDGVSDVDLDKLLDFHRSHGGLATVTSVRPPARYGHIEFDGDRVASFTEKSHLHEGWINGGFFVLEPGVMDYIDSDDQMFVHAPLERIAANGELYAYRHEGYWQCMDTMREKHLLETLWGSGDAPWRTWNQ